MNGQIPIWEFLEFFWKQENRRATLSDHFFFFFVLVFFIDRQHPHAQIGGCMPYRTWEGYLYYLYYTPERNGLKPAIGSERPII